MTKKTNLTLMIVVILGILIGSAQADTITVGPEPGYDFNTIQAAINAAVDGDTVKVWPGVYYENIYFGGKEIVLTSLDPTDPDIVARTIINGGGNGSVVYFYSAGRAAVLTGFTITGGYATWNNCGGGIFCNYANPAIINNVITDNHAPMESGSEGFGGGIGCLESVPLIRNNIITRNQAEYGGGIAVSGSRAPYDWGFRSTISSNLIYDNSARYGGGAWLAGARLVNNTIVSNAASEEGGNVWFWTLDVSSVILSNIISNATDGEGIYFAGGLSTPENFAYNNVWGNSDGDYGRISDQTGIHGNISQDPMFVYLPDHNYHLLPDSPCIDTGDPDFVAGHYVTYTDIDGDGRVFTNRVDIGADEFVFVEPVLWLSSYNFAFTAPDGCANPDEQTLFIRNIGAETINWQISATCDWLDASPAADQSSGELDEVSLTVNLEGLEPGNYNCTLTITALEATNSPQTVSVSLLVPEPVIELSAKVIGFIAPTGGPNPQDKTLTISNSGGWFFNWQIDTSCPWLQAEPMSGQSTCETDTVTLSVDTTGLTEGRYSCILRVSNADALDVFEEVEIYLYVYSGTALVVPDQYPTIQAAINAAANGDTVIVLPDTYYENINFGGKDIVLTSLNPDDTDIVFDTVIDGNDTGSVVTFAGTETTDCQLTGFTITGGYSLRRGGGILGNGTQAGIDKCIIRDNQASISSGGIHQVNGTINNCRIIRNRTFSNVGGGLSGCHGRIANCLIADNTTESEGAAAMNNCDGEIINCTIVDNKGTSVGAVKNCDGSFTNCIIWGNLPFAFTDHTAITTYSCWPDGTSSEGNINTDPLFEDADYHLSLDSPCIDAGTDAGVYTDMEGNARPMDYPGIDNNGNLPDFDMGAYEVIIPNTAPVADADTDQSVVVGDTVVLDASASTDADGDTLSYSWSLVSIPADSLAELADPNTVNPTFIPDQPGEYEVSLVVSDDYTDSQADSVTITAISLEDAAMQTIIEIQNEIVLLDPDALKNANMKNALSNKIDEVLAMIEAENYHAALKKLENDILAKTNGCAEMGEPDKNDWIKTCPQQAQIYPLILKTIDYLNTLMN